MICRCQMKAKIDGEKGMHIYARRLGIVELVFSNICVQKRMHRFTLHSKRKVDVQWTYTRFVLVHNIGKIPHLWTFHFVVDTPPVRTTTCLDLSTYEWY
jgi:hypothetical protein